MKNTGHQAISRMLYDHLKCEPLAEKAIPGFDANSVSFEVIGPVLDNDFGILYSFKLMDLIDLEYKEKMWIAGL